MFYEHKIQKYIILTLFSKVANFGVLQFYPLKMNLVPKIWKTSTRRQGYFVFEFFFTSSCSSIILIRIPLYFAYQLTLLQVTCQTNSKILRDTLNNSQIIPITRPPSYNTSYLSYNIYLPTKPDESLGQKEILLPIFKILMFLAKLLDLGMQFLVLARTFLA